MTTAAPDNGQPLAHGYVRMEEPDETEIAELCKDIGTYFTRTGYRLGSIFIDRDVPDEVLARTGFTSVLNAADRGEYQALCGAVLLPAPDDRPPGPECPSCRWVLSTRMMLSTARHRRDLVHGHRRTRRGHLGWMRPRLWGNP